MQKYKCWIVICIVTLFFSISCNKKSGVETPTSAMENYINIAMGAKSSADREKLLELTTGEAHEELKRMTDKEFVDQYVNSQFHFLGFKTKDLREENDGALSLVYELSYETKGAPNPATLTNKKVAYLVKDEQGHWKIKSTKNIKSLVEKKDALEITK